MSNSVWPHRAGFDTHAPAIYRRLVLASPSYPWHPIESDLRPDYKLEDLIAEHNGEIPIS